MILNLDINKCHINTYIQNVILSLLHHENIFTETKFGPNSIGLFIYLIVLLTNNIM